MVLYLFNPFWSPKYSHTLMRIKTPINAKPLIKDAPIKDTNKEYRALYFEEIGRRMDNSFDNSEPHARDIKRPISEDGNSISEKKPAEDKVPSTESEVDLQAIAKMVQRVAENVSRCREVPGMSVVMVKGGQSFLLPLGVADVKMGRPVTSETRFLLNSISKTFLGQLLVILISEAPENITLDTPVARILGPDFQLATKYLTQEVTLRDLMSHRSGLSSGNLAVRATYPAGWTKAKLVQQLPSLPLSVSFRKSFLYSNMGGMLAAYVAENLGGAPWEELIVEKLLSPLGMLSSRPLKSHEELVGGDFAVPYVPVDGRLTQADTKMFDQGPLSAVALLSTTPSDMARWIKFNLRQGQLEDGRQLIPRNLWSDMWTQQVQLSPMFLQAVDKSSNQWPVKDASEGYGLFWFINKYRGLKNYWHGGGLYTHYGLTWTFPEKDVGLYIVVNGYSGDSQPFSIVESLAYYTADLLLGYQPWLDEQSICHFPEQWTAETNPNSQNKATGASVDKAISDLNKLSKTESAEKEGVLQDSNAKQGVFEDMKVKQDVLEDARMSTTSSLLAGSDMISKEARKKFEAVADSFAKLTDGSPQRVLEKVSSGVHSLVKPYVASVSNRTQEILSRRIREVEMPSLVRQFQVHKQQNVFGDLDSMHEAPKYDLKVVNPVNASKKRKWLDTPNKSSEIQKTNVPLKAYHGLYVHPLIGNLTIYLNKIYPQLECKLNLLTGVLVPQEGQTFGVELTGSLRFLSKPSLYRRAKLVFKVMFSDDLTALDFHSNWAVEVPFRFLRVR